MITWYLTLIIDCIIIFYFLGLASTKIIYPKFLKLFIRTSRRVYLSMRSMQQRRRWVAEPYWRRCSCCTRLLVGPHHLDRVRVLQGTHAYAETAGDDAARSSGGGRRGREFGRRRGGEHSGWGLTSRLPPFSSKAARRRPMRASRECFSAGGRASRDKGRGGSRNRLVQATRTLSGSHLV